LHLAEDLFMPQPAWPPIERQLAEAGVRPGTALEKLIQENQEFHLLRADETTDQIGLPLWLRVHWRKQHPEGEYRADDPTGGYPRVLRNLHAWMLTHQDLQPEPDTRAVEPEPPPEPGPRPTDDRTRVAGINQRISGAQTRPRSESDIRVDYNNTNRIIAASNAIGDSRQAQFSSGDGGVTWSQTTLPLLTGDSLHSDPAVDWTSEGSAWAITIGISADQSTLQLRGYKSTDGGATWTSAATASGTQTNTDKELMWVDRSPTSPFKDNIYVIWHNGRPAFVNRRTGPNGGWQTPIQVSGAETTGTGIGGDIKTNSVGDVFAFWPDTGSRQLLVASSTNGGASFGTPVTIATTFTSFDIGVPSFASRRALVYISGGAYRTAAKDLVYAIWTDLTGAVGCTTSANEPGASVSSTCKTRIWFSRSTNGGAAWEPARMINNQTSLNDQFNPRMAVDETNSTLVVIYYDTVGDPGRLKTDVWYQTSSDDGVTWSTSVRLTTTQTDETVAGANLGNQYGDYNGLSGKTGRFFPAWTDRRSGGLEEIWTAAIGITSSLDQHVVYRGTDNYIHELWWSPTGGWQVGTLSATPAPAAAGDPSGYVLNDGQHVVYRGTDNYIHELWWSPTGGWQVGTLAATPAPAAAGDPSGYARDSG
jgi:hypothetical protein